MFRERFQWVLPLSLGAVTLGTVGFMLIEDWTALESLWMTVITMTTIGFGEVHPLSPAGRIFTILLILGGVSIGTYTVTQFTRYVVEGGLGEDLLTRRRRKRLSKLSGHYIVVGFGRLGREVATDLRYSDREVVVIDPVAEATADVQDQSLIIVGDGSSDEILRRAHIDTAAGLAIATPHSPTNVYITLVARQLRPDLPILTRVDDQEARPKALRAGATGVISPYDLGGVRMARGLLHPLTTRFLDVAQARDHLDLAIEDVRIGPDPSMHGRLRDLDIRRRFKVLIVAVRREDQELDTAPDPEVEIRAMDEVVVVGRPECIAAFSEAAGAR